MVINKILVTFILFGAVIVPLVKLGSNTSDSGDHFGRQSTRPITNKQQTNTFVGLRFVHKYKSAIQKRKSNFANIQQQQTTTNTTIQLVNKSFYSFQVQYTMFDSWGSKKVNRKTTIASHGNNMQISVAVNFLSMIQILVNNHRQKWATFIPTQTNDFDFTIINPTSFTMLLIVSGDAANTKAIIDAKYTNRGNARQLTTQLGHFSITNITSELQWFFKQRWGQAVMGIMLGLLVCVSGIKVAAFWRIRYFQRTAEDEVVVKSEIANLKAAQSEIKNKSSIGELVSEQHGGGTQQEQDGLRNISNVTPEHLVNDSFTSSRRPLPSTTLQTDSSNSSRQALGSPSISQEQEVINEQKRTDSSVQKRKVQRVKYDALVDAKRNEIGSLQTRGLALQLEILDQEENTNALLANIKEEEARRDRAISQQGCAIVQEQETIKRRDFDTTKHDTLYQDTAKDHATNLEKVEDINKLKTQERNVTLTSKREELARLTTDVDKFINDRECLTIQWHRLNNLCLEIKENRIDISDRGHRLLATI